MDDLPGQSSQPNVNQRAQQIAQRFTQSAQQRFKQLTTRTYALPDKTVASQVLMYRQLLHTHCRPGLKLSRDYQGTEAQLTVRDMPWWTPGLIASEQKMVISYDNLVMRLWVSGVVKPYEETSVEGNLLNEEGLPPVPHEYWVSRAGFQQTDPVTDFRSGGVLSLASMVYIVESCPQVHARFTTGDASVLPFGITSINITDMMAHFLMLAKKVDRMDALLSQKPFWKMFADPYALLTCHELAMDLLADVVVEWTKKRPEKPVSVFDFPNILEETQQRVERDLLGAGPTSVTHLREIHTRIRQKYLAAMEERNNPEAVSPTTPRSAAAAKAKAQAVATQFAGQATQWAGQASGWTGNIWNKTKKARSPVAASTTAAVDVAPEATSAGAAAQTEDDGSWVVSSATEGVSNFSIGDEDDDDDL